MNPSEITVVLALLSIALFSVYLISKILVIKLAPVKYESIEGLRGYLAFFVFIHHAAFWQGYLQHGTWSLPDSNLFIQFGKASVAIFFMITGFLFFGKLRNAPNKPIDWIEFFISRLLRLTPLYIFAMCCMLLIVAILSSYTWVENPRSVLLEMAKWLGFSIYGIPDINGVKNTFLITAGVSWSLVYEWLFYFSLPAIGFIFYRIKSSFVTFLGTLALTASIYLSNIIFTEYLCMFLVGAFAVYLVDQSAVQRFLQSRLSTFLIASLSTLMIVFFTGNTWVELLIMGFIFTAIAAGNSLGGILTTRVSRIFGQITYSMYLLHGLILFITFRFLVHDSRMDDIHFWSIIALCVVPVVVLCFLTFYLIELPGMELAGYIRKIIYSISKNEKVYLNNDKNKHL